MRDQIPLVEYTEEEVKLWQKMWDKLIPAIEEHGCKEMNHYIKVLHKDGIFLKNEIPQ